MAEYYVIGKRLPRVDGAMKATGEAKFLVDIKMPGMLYGKVVRSPLAHAKIKSIDISRALRLPGVKAVITGNDAPKVKYSMFWGTSVLADRIPLADGKVRFVAEPVAAVAAIDEDTAEEATELISVEYEELPAVFDGVEAMQPGAPLIHEIERNILVPLHRHFGNVEKGFAEADYIFDDKFTTTIQAIACMEVHGGVAQFDGSGRLTLWTATQNHQRVRAGLARYLGMSRRDVRVINAFGGGGFGSKDGMEELPIAVLLAKRAGRPVKVINTRQEEFMTAGHRHPQVITIKTGVTKDGMLTSREVTNVIDAGAYERASYITNMGTGYKAAQLYCPVNLKYDGYVVYTNNPPGHAFRGFGGTPSHFVMESQMDIIAEKLGIDPVEIRLKNANYPGQITASGAEITSCGLSECIAKAAEAAGWKEKRGTGNNRGVGTACMIHSGGGSKGTAYNINSAEAFIEIDEQGVVNLLVGEPDLGTGSATILSQIAAEEIGVRFEDVQVASGDTDTIPLSTQGSHASRVTFVAGNAVKMTAAEVKKQLYEVAAELLEANIEDLRAGDRKIWVAGAPDKAIPIPEVVSSVYSKTGRTVSATACYTDLQSTGQDERGYGDPSPTHSFGAQVVEVEVDRETGLVNILDFVAAHDMGFAINPMFVEGQIQGAASQGIGYGVTEQLIWERGRTLNPNFADYKVPGSLDVPNIRTILVETIDDRGPFGAKGVGEPGMVPTAPAIANAVYDAVGVRIKDIPMTPEKILRALKEKQ